MDKGTALEQLYNQWSNCQRCALKEHRKHVVFGCGNPESQVMIVGEAPGENEDRIGIPFIGDAGNLLDQYLSDISVRLEVKAKCELVKSSRGKEEARVHQWDLHNLLMDEFFFTNVVACHPPENRDPTQTEVKACLPRLQEAIYLVDPLVLVAVGRIALEALLGRKMSITHVRGQMFDIQLPGRLAPVKYAMIATLHTSYLMRRGNFNDENLERSEAWQTYQDWIRVLHLVDQYNEAHFGTPRPFNRPKLGEKEKKKR